jgi:hypothetical protein
MHHLLRVDAKRAKLCFVFHRSEALRRFSQGVRERHVVFVNSLLAGKRGREEQVELTSSRRACF